MQRVDACFDEFTAIVSFRLVVRVVRGSLEASGAQLDAASVAVVVVVAGVNFHRGAKTNRIRRTRSLQAWTRRMYVLVVVVLLSSHRLQLHWKMTMSLRSP